MSPLSRSLTAVASHGADLLPRWVSAVAEVVLRSDLPGLPEDRRARAVAFVAERCTGLPSVMRLGVGVIAAVYRGLLMLPAGATIVAARLAARSLPLLGEFPRLIRSLAFAFVWETWPDTRADGSPA